MRRACLKKRRHASHTWSIIPEHPGRVMSQAALQTFRLGLRHHIAVSHMRMKPLCTGFLQCTYLDGDKAGYRCATEHANPKRTILTDLLMGLFRGAVFGHGEGARKQPIKQPTEMPTSTMALMGRFPSLMGRFPTLMGRFSDFALIPFYLWKIHCKTTLS